MKKPSNKTELFNFVKKMKDEGKSYKQVTRKLNTLGWKPSEMLTPEEIRSARMAREFFVGSGVSRLMIGEGYRMKEFKTRNRKKNVRIPLVKTTWMGATKKQQIEQQLPLPEKTSTQYVIDTILSQLSDDKKAEVLKALL
jgi:hypothetical protein